LNALASILSEPVQITWQSVTEGIFHTAQLRPDGMISVSDGTSFDEPGQAARHCEPAKSVDGWGGAELFGRIRTGPVLADWID